MQIHRRARGLLQAVDAADVVVVRVREQDGLALQGVLAQIAEYLLRLPAGVDDGAEPGLIIRNDIAVGAQIAHRKAFDRHGPDLQ